MKRERFNMASTITHPLCTSLDALLRPETLSQIAGHGITEVKIEEREVKNSVSGSPFLSVTAQGEGLERYVVKRVNWAWDWLMQAFDDRLCREVQLWSSGLLDRLPPELIHAIVAGAKDGDGWAILMTDYGHLLANETLNNFAPDETSNCSYLNALAALHAHYLDDPALLDPALGLCEPSRYLTAFSPRVLENEIDGEIPRLFIRSWDRFDTCFAPQTVRIVRGLHQDPQPLCAALQQFPQTLVHGDWAPRNLALCPQCPPKTLVIDWQFAQRGPPVIDLFRYLLGFGSMLPVPHDESIRYYRERYELHSGMALDDELWDAQVELGVLGNFLLFGGNWSYLREERRRLAELPWIEQKILAGAARL